MSRRSVFPAKRPAPDIWRRCAGHRVGVARVAPPARGGQGGATRFSHLLIHGNDNSIERSNYAVSHRLLRLFGGCVSRWHLFPRVVAFLPSDYSHSLLHCPALPEFEFLPPAIPARDATRFARRELSTQTVFSHEAIARKQGLNATDTRCLDLISRAGDEKVTAGDLGKATGLTTGAVTGILDRLEKAGMVQRERDTRDRRKWPVVVS